MMIFKLKNKMLKIFITKGLPASGKSTWSKQKCLDYPNTIIVNRDSIRTMLKGGINYFPHGSSLEKIVTKIERGAVVIALDKGYNVIIDATNFRIPTDWIADISLTYDCKVEIVDFTDVSVEECIERDSKREFPVGEEVIRRMFDKYVKEY
jgi:predicted kinase